MIRGETLWILGQRSRLTFDTVYKTSWARYRLQGTLMILGHGAKGQGQRWLQFLPNHFQTSHGSCL